MREGLSCVPDGSHTLSSPASKIRISSATEPSVPRGMTRPEGKAKAPFLARRPRFAPIPPLEHQSCLEEALLVLAGCTVERWMLSSKGDGATWMPLGSSGEQRDRCQRGIKRMSRPHRPRTRIPPAHPIGSQETALGEVPHSRSATRHAIPALTSRCVASCPQVNPTNPRERVIRLRVNGRTVPLCMKVW